MVRVAEYFTKQIASAGAALIFSPCSLQSVNILILKLGRNDVICIQGHTRNIVLTRMSIEKVPGNKHYFSCKYKAEDATYCCHYFSRKQPKAPPNSDGVSNWFLWKQLCSSHGNVIKTVIFHFCPQCVSNSITAIKKKNKNQT